MAASTERARPIGPSMLAAAIVVVTLASCAPGRNSVNAEVTYPSARAVTSSWDGEFSEFLAVERDASSGELHSIEFYETRPDLGEIDRLSRVGWGIAAPENAALFVASSGLLSDALGIAWAGWREDDQIHATSLALEQPVSVVVREGDRLVDPPLIAGSKALHQYLWRASSEGWNLLRHEFTGKSSNDAGVSTVSVGESRREPLASAVLAIPGATNGEAVVAWVTRTSEGLVTELLLLAGASPSKLVSDPVRLASPLADQRPALVLDAAGNGRAAWIAEDEQVVLVEIEFAFGARASKAVTKGWPDVTGTLQSARAFYLRSPTHPGLFACALDADGRLTLRKASGEIQRVLRDDVEASYDYPIVTSMGGRYEARHGDAGELQLVPLDEH